MRGSFDRPNIAAGGPSPARGRRAASLPAEHMSGEEHPVPTPTRVCRVRPSQRITTLGRFSGPAPKILPRHAFRAFGKPMKSGPGFGPLCAFCMAFVIAVGIVSRETLLLLSTFSAYIRPCRGNPAMAINGRRNKPFGPGGSTRRLHPSPAALRANWLGFGGGEIGSTRA